MMKPSPQKTAVEFASPSLLRVFAAMAYDILLLAALSIAYGFMVTAIRVSIFGAPEMGQRIHWSLSASIVISLGWLLTIMVFYIYFWHRAGQTLGMKTWRFQVVDGQTLQFPSLKQSAIRSAGALISLAFFGVGYWIKWLHPQGMLFHDWLSGTQLVLLKKDS